MKHRTRLLSFVLLSFIAPAVHATDVFDSPGPGYRDQIRQHELRRPSFDLQQAIKSRWPALKTSVSSGPVDSKPAHVLERERLLLLRADSQPLLGDPLPPSTVNPAK